MVLITLLRHAPLPLMYQKRFIGHSDIEIDKALTNLSKFENIKNRNYDYIYSSDLLRCKQTLDLIDFKYKEDNRLREVKFKIEFEGKDFNEVEKLDSYDVKYLSSMKSWHDFVCVESLDEFQSRIKSFLDELPNDGDILICSHAGAIKMIHSILEEINFEKSLFKIDYSESVDFIL